VLLPFTLVASLCFAGGAVFGYFIAFPPVFRFLIGYANEWLVAMPAVEEYFSLALRLFLAFGLIFDLPVLMVFLGKVGLVNRALLARNRKYAVLTAFVAAAILTPTPDAINQCLMALPIMLLYEISIWTVAIFARKPFRGFGGSTAEKGQEAPATGTLGETAAVEPQTVQDRIAINQDGSGAKQAEMIQEQQQSGQDGEQQRMQKILVTGAAGFIGHALSKRLLAAGRTVVGLDNLNDYYSVQLKRDRLSELLPHRAFTFVQEDMAKREAMTRLFADGRFDVVVNLAAQAGVRHSLINPAAYVDTNLVGFGNILEGCRNTGVRHLVFASSSSVYGANTKMPFSEHDNVDHPVSLYAASKKANELMAHTYSHLFGLPATGLRFFTVYGPWGRPDMALFLFTRAILEGRPINVFNNGDMERDFTYIDDIVEGVIRVMDRLPAPNPEWSGQTPDPATSYCPWRVYNIGNNRKERLLHYIEVLEDCLGRKAEKNFLPMQPGDVPATWADAGELVRDTGFQPDTPIETGVQRFVDWYLDYYQCRKFIKA